MSMNQSLPVGQKCRHTTYLSIYWQRKIISTEEIQLRKVCKSCAYGEWVTSFDLWCSSTVKCAGKPIEWWTLNFLYAVMLIVSVSFPCYSFWRMNHLFITWCHFFHQKYFNSPVRLKVNTQDLFYAKEIW